MRLSDLPPHKRGEARALIEAQRTAASPSAPTTLQPAAAQSVGLPAREPSAFPLTLWLPLPLNLGNARLHRMAEVIEKRRFWRELDGRAGARLLPPPPAAPAPVTLAAVDVYRDHERHLNDKDNAHRRLKWVWDWLTRRAYIAGDDETRLRYTLDQHVRTPGATPELCSIRITLSTPEPRHA